MDRDDDDDDDDDDNGKGFRMCVKLLMDDDKEEGGPGRMSWRCVEIPFSELNPHKDHDCNYYTAHDHVHGDPARFRNIPPSRSRLICQNDDCNSGRTVLLGSSSLYTFHSGQLFRLNVDDATPTAPSRWTPIPVPFFSTTFDPVLVASHNQHLCLLGVSLAPNPSTVGVIFDPTAPDEKSFIEIEKPLKWCIKGGRNLFAEYFGDSEGKILIADPRTETIPLSKEWKYQFTYDVLKGGVWESFRATEFIQIIGEIASKVVTVEEDRTMYWIDVHGFFCAYSWEEKVVLSGPIVGLEHEGLLDLLGDKEIDVPLLHLGKDMFCLVWESHDREGKTELHFSIGVVKHDPTSYRLPLPCS